MDIRDIIPILYETDEILAQPEYRIDVRQKGDADFVTRADLEISHYLHRRLGEVAPDVGFFSEEETPGDLGSKYWILDPIDGTTNFVHDLRLSAISLGYCENGEVTAGIIYVPYTRELFWAQKGKGAYLGGTPLHVTSPARLKDCLCLMELNGYYKSESDASLGEAKRLFSSCLDLRVLGCTALSLAWLACGRIDAFYGRRLKPWDYAAGMILVTEAGGQVACVDAPFDITRRESNIAAGAAHLEELAAVIRGE